MYKRSYLVVQSCREKHCTKEAQRSDSILIQKGLSYLHTLHAYRDFGTLKVGIKLVKNNTIYRQVNGSTHYTSADDSNTLSLVLLEVIGEKKKTTTINNLWDREGFFNSSCVHT